MDGCWIWSEKGRKGGGEKQGTDCAEPLLLCELPPAGEPERRMGVRLEGGPGSSFPNNEGLILGREMPPRRQAHTGAVTAYQWLFYAHLDGNASVPPSRRLSCDR